MLASRQWHTDVTVGTLPTNLTGAVVGGPALTMDAPAFVVVTNRFQAWVEKSLLVLVIRLFPSRLADDVSLAVADVPGCVLEVLRLAGMVVDIQGCEPHSIDGVDCHEAEDDQRC